MGPEKRFYRSFQKPKGFKTFEVIAGESDLWIAVPEEAYRPEVEGEVLSLLVEIRSQIEAYGKSKREFFTSLTPVEVEPIAPLIVKKMAVECGRCGVGPMAGVAGAVNLFVAQRLKALGIKEFIIENGGDLFISRSSPTLSLLLTGNPKLDGKLALEVPPGEWGLSSSSSKIGHSLSLGRAQVATVLARSPIYSDCCATFLGNSVSPEDALDRINSLKGAHGALVFIDGKFVIKGTLKPVFLGRA